MAPRTGRIERGTRVLRLPAACRRELEARARAAYPLEACGLLLGRALGAAAEVVAVAEGANLHPRPTEGFDLDPAAQVRAEERAREQGLDVIGTWHSHPERPARPSAADQRSAWAGWSHVIVAVDGVGTSELRSWRLRGRVLVEEPLSP